MVFATAANIERPMRLSSSTRNWAWESLHGKYGDEAINNGFINLDNIENFEAMSDIEKYDIAIKTIAQQAPIRICQEEKICSSATLGGAIYHRIPAKYKEEPVFLSVSHLTIRYDKVLNQGLDSYKKDIAERLKDKSLSDKQKVFLNSLDNVIEAIRIWHSRYLKATENTRPDLHKLLLQVPFSQARNFHEALQSLWFIFSFVRLCGNWPGIGRLDWLLGDFLKKDLNSKELDISQARELLASFFIKGCEWIQSNTPQESGDAQHYQNIVLSGIDSEGKEITNEVTFLTLDIVEELSISDFPITVRLNKNSPLELKEKVAAVMRHGGGIVAVYNEDLILQALRNDGYSEKEACNFANDGCWEVQIPGKTDFIYIPFDGLQIFNEAIGLTKEADNNFSSIEEIYSAFYKRLKEEISNIYKYIILEPYIFKDNSWQSKKDVTPTSVISLFEDGCIKNARAYYDFGPEYLVRSPHIGGSPDIANSLYAIEKFVFLEKRISFEKMLECLRNNWEDNEELRLYIKNNSLFYGNDEDKVDKWHSRILNDFADIVENCKGEGDCPAKFIPGVSTFGRQIEWLPNRCATAFGYKKGDILSGNDSPTPGTDINGATSVIKSYCKTDLVRQSCGAALDIKIFPESLSGGNGIASLIAFMDGFLKLGGFFMQLDAVDTKTLLDAQKNPHKYKTLSVRVSGWNARFVTLNREWQNMIIERNTQNIN